MLLQTANKLYQVLQQHAWSRLGGKMELYYVNRRAHARGEHEVHREACSFMPFAKNRYCLGVFHTCSDAVQEAKKFYPKSDGCFFCARKSHKA